MAKPVILVLEDTRERVTWLRQMVGTRADILWVWRVKDFLSAIDVYGKQLALIIMDHDIPPPAPDDDEPVWSHTDLKDVDGKSGYDAALEMPDVAAPVLVWSVNSVGADQMSDVLVRKAARVMRVPFLDIYKNRLDVEINAALSGMRF